MVTAQPAPDKRTLDQYLAVRRHEAAQLAAAGRHRQAIAVLGACKERVEKELQQIPGRGRADAQDTAYRAEMSALGKWFREQQSAARSGKTSLRQVLSTYEARKAALDKTYGAERRDRARAAQVESGRQARAPLRLKLADLDEQSSAYYPALGERERAAADLLGAWLTRLETYSQLKREAEARGAAARLLGLKSRNPMAYDAAGRFFQERSDFTRAAGAWREVIALIESGRALIRKPSMPGAVAPKQHPQLEEFYRELAYCLHRLNQPAESRQALDRAEALRRSSESAAIKAQEARRR